MSRSAAPIDPLPGLDVESQEARLAVLEALLGSVDLHASADQALEWLQARQPLDAVLVAVCDPLSPYLTVVASRGVSTAAIGDFIVRLDDDGSSVERGDAADRAFAYPESARCGRRSTAVPSTRCRSAPTLAGRRMASALVSSREPETLRRRRSGCRVSSRNRRRASACGRASRIRGSDRSGCCSTASSTRSPTRSC